MHDGRVELSILPSDLKESTEVGGGVDQLQPVTGSVMSTRWIPPPEILMEFLELPGG